MGTAAFERRRGRTLINTKFFYDYGRVLSYNGVFVFIVGGRGIGKTYGAKVKVVKNYLKNGAQFIYLRRYQTELKTRQTFFSDFAHEFPGYAFRVQGSEAQLTRDPDSDKPTWETIGYFVSLSTAQAKKSVAYPDVTVIIYDEFIIEKSNIQYLPDETTIMQNFFSTVDRSQDKTQVWFLANSVSIMNPYFMTYGIDVDANREKIMAYKDGFVVCDMPYDGDFANAASQSRFGKFIADTEYEAYAVGNQFVDNNKNLIGNKTDKAEYLLTIFTDAGTFSVWSDVNDFSTTYHCQKKRPKEERKFTTNLLNVDETTTYIEFSDKVAGALRTAYRHGRMTFDAPETRNAMLQLFKR